VTATGDLIVGGQFATAGGITANGIARWNGSAWSSLGTSPLAEVRSIKVTPDGALVAAGYDGVYRWDGTAWAFLGLSYSGSVNVVTDLPNGDLVAGASDGLPAGSTARSIARFDGTSWSTIGLATNYEVIAFATGPNGDLIVGGSFTRAGGLVSARLARLTTTCPATVANAGFGCSGSGGASTLTSTTLPWVESTFRATGSNLPAPCYVLSVYGLSPVVPAFALDSVFPEALAGCNLHVMPDGIETLFTATGTVQSQILLPNTPPLVGVSFYHQMVPVVVDAQLSPLEISATNALQLTAGMF
jgi:hypothetical protein